MSLTALLGRPRRSTRSVLASADRRGNSPGLVSPDAPTPRRSRVPRCASLAAGAQHLRARPPTPRPPTAGHQAPVATRSAWPPAPDACEPPRTSRTAGRCRNRRYQPAPGVRHRRRRATTGRHRMGHHRRPARRLIQHQLPQAVRRHAVPVSRSGPGHRHTPRSGRRGDLLRQPGLPDPRLTRAQHQAADARQGIIQQQHDASQLTVTAHHRPRDPALRSPHQATIKPKDIGGLGMNSLEPYPRTRWCGRAVVALNWSWSSHWPARTMTLPWPGWGRSSGVFGARDGRCLGSGRSA